MSRVVLIAGCHRGGTSATAGVLQRLGVYLGRERDLMPANHANPRGYHEHLSAVALNDALLDRLTGGWDSPTRMPWDWLEQPATRMVQRKVRQLLLQLRMEANGQPFGIKDPRFCRTLPLWVRTTRELGMDPLVVEAYRGGEASARSLMDREGWDWPTAIWLVRSYWGELWDYLTSVRGREVPFVRLHFEHMVNEWRREAKYLERFIPELFPIPEDRAREVDEFLDKQLVHH